MDDERDIRDGLERIASDLPAASPPPERFRRRARRRMVVSGTLAGLVAVALVGGSVVALQAIAGNRQVGASPSPPSGAASTNSASSPATAGPVEHIAFQSNRSGNEDIWIMDADGSNLRDLTNDPATDVEPTWSPDGRQIAFASDRSGQLDIWVMNADGTDPVDVTNTPDAAETFPAWSPTERWIAYLRAETRIEGVSLDQIWLMRPDGSGQRGLLLDDAAHGRPSWSPDGASLVFARISRLASALWLAEVGGAKSLRQLTTGPADSAPTWCPDGNPIAYVRVVESDSVNAASIWFVDPGGGPGRRAVTGARSPSSPTWSPDGRMLAFVVSHPRRSPAGDIEVIQSSDSAPKRLTSGPADDWAPAWQPVAT